MLPLEIDASKGAEVQHGGRIVYETHQISTENEAGVATGWLPGELSAEGCVLGRRVDERRRDDGFAVDFTSDLRRAVETAELAFGGRGIPIV
jgi:broad specificity phosphatase PhoE